MTTKIYKNLPIELFAGTTLDTQYPYFIYPQTENTEFEAPAFQFRIPLTSGMQLDNAKFMVLDCHYHAKSPLLIKIEFRKKEETIFYSYNRMVCDRRLLCCARLEKETHDHPFPRLLPGQFRSGRYGKICDMSEIDDIFITVKSGRDLKGLELFDIYFTEQLPDFSFQPIPLVDRFGQRKDMEWKGKIHSEEELASYLRKEYENAAFAYETPSELDRYGGYKALHFEEKGYFYKHFDGKTWWLVDPLGNAFFSNGVCYACRAGEFGLVDSFEELYEELPDRNDETFADAWTTSDTIPEFVKRNAGTGQKRLLVNFARANMIRVFGKDHWLDAWMTIQISRLKKWGFNTIGVGVNQYDNEETDRFLQLAQMPYCITLKNFPKTKQMLYREFPDVFSSEYKELCARYAAWLKPYANDPFFIGYFMTNEPEWRFNRQLNIAERTFAHPVYTESKKVLIETLKTKYTTIENLNIAWNTTFTSFESLEAPMEQINLFSPAAEQDFRMLSKLLTDEYSKVPADAIRKVAPHSLNLGMRNPGAKCTDFFGTEYFDIYSYNCYSATPHEMFDLVKQQLDMPFIIGEWHYGSTESGLLSNATFSATSQKERGKACAEYMREALLNPNCIGVHYFEYNDQPLLGRFDGEMMQIGLIDVCNRPYEDCIQEYAAINHIMYEIRTGKKTVEPICWEREPKYY